MSISTLGELKAAVASWLNQGNLTTYIPDFIALAEQRIKFGGEFPFSSQPVRVPEMQDRATGTASGSISLPTDFLEPIRLNINQGGTTYDMDYVPAGQFTARVNGQSQSFYTILDGQIVLSTSTALPYTFDYYKLASLSGDSSTNWILTNAPGVYLYGALVESVGFTKDDPRISQWQGAFKSAVAALNRSTNFQGPIQVRAS